MRIAILYNDVPEDAPLDERDVLVQRDAVAAALAELGHEPLFLPCTVDLESVRRRLVGACPDVVFNLVESLGGTDRWMALATLLLDGLGIPYTGASTMAMLRSGCKPVAKAVLRSAGVPTPWWMDAPASRPYGAIGPDGRGEGSMGPRGDGFVPGETYIVKSAWEHGSLGLDGKCLHRFNSLVEAQQLLERANVPGRPVLLERFIAGREFNLSLLAQRGGAVAAGKGAAQVQVLPPAEIEFSGFAAGVPRIVDYRAKWDAESFAYRHTLRRFDFGDGDADLLKALAAMAERCWDIFSLRGYARIDFRVDDAGRCWVLEVNVNPCLSPDAGFAAAVERAGLPFAQAVRRIVEDAGPG